MNEFSSISDFVEQERERLKFEEKNMIEETKIKTHTSISVKFDTRAKLEEYRRYERETFDEIISRLISNMDSRRGKKTDKKDGVDV